MLLRTMVHNSCSGAIHSVLFYESHAEQNRACFNWGTACSSAVFHLPRAHEMRWIVSWFRCDDNAWYTNFIHTISIVGVQMHESALILMDRIASDLHIGGGHLWSSGRCASQDGQQHHCMWSKQESCWPIGGGGGGGGTFAGAFGI